MREGDTRRVSPSRSPVFSCAHYFQAPATQAIFDLARTTYDIAFFQETLVSDETHIKSFTSRWSGPS